VGGCVCGLVGYSEAFF